MKNVSKDYSIIVISILRVKDYCGKDCEPYWEYASYDIYSGSFSTGYPCFSNIKQAIKFDSIEDAEQKFDKWWRDFVHGHSSYRANYDMSTLGIRELKLNTVQEKHLIAV